VHRLTIGTRARTQAARAWHATTQEPHPHHVGGCGFKLRSLPTPPLSPGIDRSQLSETTIEMDVDESIKSILHQMMASSEELLAFDSQTSSSSSEDLLNIDPNILLSSPQALLQDCMWNCDAYEP
jgi:hypothetical protein